MPSTEALRYHWLRCTWVRSLWKQAEEQTIITGDLTEFGWSLATNKLSFVWDSPTNMAEVRESGSTHKRLQLQNWVFTKKCNNLPKQESPQSSLVGDECMALEIVDMCSEETMWHSLENSFMFLEDNEETENTEQHLAHYHESGDDESICDDAVLVEQDFLYRLQGRILTMLDALDACL